VAEGNKATAQPVPEQRLPASASLLVRTISRERGDHPRRNGGRGKCTEVSRRCQGNTGRPRGLPPRVRWTVEGTHERDRSLDDPLVTKPSRGITVDAPPKIAGVRTSLGLTPDVFARLTGQEERHLVVSPHSVDEAIGQQPVHGLTDMPLPEFAPGRSKAPRERGGGPAACATACSPAGREGLHRPCVWRDAHWAGADGPARERARGSPPRLGGRAATSPRMAHAGAPLTRTPGRLARRAVCTTRRHWAHASRDTARQRGPSSGPLPAGRLCPAKPFHTPAMAGARWPRPSRLPREAPRGLSGSTTCRSP
jgi:hypothetical protein